ncbi:hypothetical protein [Enhygromyxa salina]|uniref:Uncharacterized protein n=1 Tax=Enhygromyxa salina TaxID=215803 RepID=A0A2S9YJ14_9BACT|nr:hypothetical protein [Enhygromyxa salina]PRQ05042.1 hypothetical protein ENSA7_48250 [Enhygromyxa salina]
MFHFVPNLKPYTLVEDADEGRFDAYLLSADYTRGLADLAGLVRTEGRVLIADNGNMDVFRGIGKEFAADAAKLDNDRRAWETANGRYARPQDLPVELSSRFRTLAQAMAVRSESITTDAFARDAVRRQVSIDPSLLVGMEDLTVGTMGGLNLEPEYVDLPASFFEERAQRAVTFTRRTIDGEFGEVDGKVLAGLHALDYDSAVLAGRVAAEAGLDGITVGLFGALTDRNYVDYRVEDGQVIELAATVPRPYLRVIEISAGVLEGFRRVGRPRPAFHALGVGTPILLPLLSLLGQGENYFATDSTAPIVDGWSSPTISLYVLDEASAANVTTFTEEAAAFVDDGFSQFYQLFAGDNPSIADARLLARTVLDQTGAVGHSIAQVLGNLSCHGIPPEFLAELGPVSVDLAEAGARLGLLVAYSANVLGHAHSLAAESWLARERKAATRDALSKVPTGVKAQIGAIGQFENDVLVEVEGRIESLSLDHDPNPPKFSSFVVLRAFGEGASVRLRAHMFSLARNGLVEGACCTIRGFIRRQQPWLEENEVGIDIDRVSLSKLRKLSWLDDVAYRMRPFFRLYQDEMNLFNTPGRV